MSADDDGLSTGLDAARLRAWAVLDLGPLWVPRARAGGTAADAAPVAEAVPPPPDPAPAEPLPEVLADAAARSPAGTVHPVERMDWQSLRDAVSGCQRCKLCESRTQTVFGEGESNARWMLIGEAPGAEEDRQGRPFVGTSGKLLDRMLASIGMRRGQDVFITNVLKCRPPGNRDPQPMEIAECGAYLRRQIELLQPGLLLLAGRFAAQTVLGTDRSIGSLRGRVHHVEVAGRSIPAVCTYHPAYLLHNPDDKRQSWRDLNLALKAAREAAETTPPQ